MKLLVSILLLIIPTWYEVFRDRHGDAHPNSDWKLRGFMCLVCGALVGMIHGDLVFGTIKYTLSAIFLFAALFPYWINFVHLKNGVTSYMIPARYDLLNVDEILEHVKNHLSKTAWPDKTWWWIKLGANGRFIVYLVFFILAIITYVL